MRKQFKHILLLVLGLSFAPTFGVGIERVFFAVEEYEERARGEEEIETLKEAKGKHSFLKLDTDSSGGAGLSAFSPDWHILPLFINSHCLAQHTALYGTQKVPRYLLYCSLRLCATQV